MENRQTADGLLKRQYSWESIARDQFKISKKKCTHTHVATFLSRNSSSTKTRIVNQNLSLFKLYANTQKKNE